MRGVVQSVLDDEVHDLQDGRVEAGEQFIGDDDELQGIGWVSEAVEELLLGVLKPV